MSIIPDELKTQTFPCPNCKQIISSEQSSCRFCNFEISDEHRSILIRTELRENSLTRLRNHKIYMGVGAAIFVGGLLTLATPILESYADARMVNFSCWTPLLIIGGIGAFVMGLNGYTKEQRYLKDV